MNIAYAINVEVPLTNTTLLMQAYRLKDTDSILIFTKTLEDNVWEFGHSVRVPEDMNDATAFGHVEAYLNGSMTHDRYRQIFSR